MQNQQLPQTHARENGRTEPRSDALQRLNYRSSISRSLMKKALITVRKSDYRGFNRPRVVGGFSLAARKWARDTSVHRAYVHSALISANDVLRWHTRRWMLLARAWCCCRGLSLAFRVVFSSRKVNVVVVNLIWLGPLPFNSLLMNYLFYG